MTSPSAPTPATGIAAQLAHLVSGTVVFGTLGAIAALGPKIAANPKDIQGWLELVGAIGAIWRARVAIAKNGTGS